MKSVTEIFYGLYSYIFGSSETPSKKKSERANLVKIAQNIYKQTRIETHKAIKARKINQLDMLECFPGSSTPKIWL